MRVTEVPNQKLTCVLYHVRNLNVGTCLKTCQLGFLLMLSGIDSNMHMTPHTHVGFLMCMWMTYPVQNEHVCLTMLGI